MMISSVQASEEKAPIFLKIGLSYGSNCKNECTLKSDNGFLGYIDGVNVFSADEKEIIIKSDGNNITVYGLSGNEYYTANSVEISAKETNIIKLGDTPYRGTMLLSPDPNGIKVINCVELEDYLKSVVPSEMPALWHTEALKAQAVCARNYALSNLGKYKAEGFDMDDTVSNQVYRGVNSEHINTTKAVEETKGVKLLYDDKLVETYFFSSGAGSTEDVINVWTNDIPYLKSVTVPNEEIKEWEVVFTPEELETRLKASGVEIGTVRSFDIKRSKSGRVIEITLTGENGKYTAKKEKARTLFGLKSALYDIEFSGSEIEVPDFSEYSPEIKLLLKGKYNIEKMLNKPVPDENTTYTFKGKGNGHAIGLSQYGAKALAEAGYSFEEILTHFYTGSYIEKPETNETEKTEEASEIEEIEKILEEGTKIED